MLSTQESISRVAEINHSPDISPSMEQVLAHMKIVTSQTALSAWKGIQEEYMNGVPPQTKEEIDEFAFSLDVIATTKEEQVLHHAGFMIQVRASEGLKENRKYGKILPIPEGYYGFGQYLPFDQRGTLKDRAKTEKLGNLQIILDPIEGTSKAGRNENGAIAVMAGSNNGGLVEVPKEDGDAHYTERIVAGARMVDKVHLGMFTSEIIKQTSEAYGLQEGQKVQVYVLDRPRNQKLIDELLEAGAEIIPLSGGDLTPALAALKDDKAILSMGSGGKEEAYIAAIAAKAVGGVFEGRYVDKNGVASKEHPEDLTLDYLAPGNPSDYFVNLSSITGNKDLGLDAITSYQNGILRYKVPALTITSTGYFEEYVLFDEEVDHFSDRSVWPDDPDLAIAHFVGQKHRLIAPQASPQNTASESSER